MRIGLAERARLNSVTDSAQARRTQLEIRVNLATHGCAPFPHNRFLLSRALLLLASFSLAACGGGGGGKSGAGGGGSATAFTQQDRAGLWRGVLAEAGSADLPFGIRFATDGSFQRLGEGYRDYSVAISDDFSTSNGALSLESSSSNGSDRLTIDAEMDDDKARIFGSWQRFDGGALVGTGSFSLSPVSTRPRAASFAGDWSGDFFSTGQLDLSAASFESNGAGAVETVAIGAQRFLLPFDSFLVSGIGEMLEVEVASTALLRRYELIGGFNAQGTVYSGTWRYYDAWQSGGPLDDGSFVLRKDLAAYPRALVETSGDWSGTASHPALGETDFQVEFDADGILISGSFGEFGGTPIDLVEGLAEMSSDYSGFAASLEDTFSQFGSDTIEIEGVLSPVTQVWSGSLSHYFWGACTFSLVKQ